MRAIFSRSPLNGNASWRALAWIVATLSFVLTSCATPSIPPNVIIGDAHTSGDSLAFSTHSAYLASGGNEGRIWLWRLPQATALAQWQAHKGPVEGMAFIEQDRTLLSSGYDGTIVKWELDGGMRLRRETPAPITDIAVDESGDLLVTAHTDGVVRTWTLSDLSPRREWRLLDGELRAVAYHAATQRFAAGGADVFVWRANETPRPLPTPPTEARELAFAPDGQWLTGGGWFKLFQWHVADGALTVLPTEHRGIIRSLDYSADGKTLATISRQTDSAVYFLDPLTAQVQRRFQPHDLCGARVRLSRDGRYLASTADDATVRLWDLTNPLPQTRDFARLNEK